LFGVPLTGILLLIAAAEGVLNCGFREVIFHPSLNSDTISPNSLHSSLNGDIVFLQVGHSAKIGGHLLGSEKSDS